MTAVNFGELKISRNTAETLVAFSIGSGIGVSIYDPIIKAGGILSFVLPDSSEMSSAKAQFYPFMFADTGLAAFLDLLFDIGAQAESLKVVLAGGAQVMSQVADYNIGRLNYQAVCEFLDKMKIAVHHADIGGICIRTLRLDIGDGHNHIQAPGQPEVIL
jgi:chemotaxis protein CheD